MLEALTLSIPSTEDKNFEDVIKLKWGHQSGLSSNMTGVLMRKRDTRGSSAQRYNHVKRQKEGICNSRREASEETISALTLIVDFQPSKLWENKFLLFKPPSLCFLLCQPQQTNTPRKHCPWGEKTRNTIRDEQIEVDKYAGERGQKAMKFPPMYCISSVKQKATLSRKE